VVCFGKFSLSDVPIRNNQGASDGAGAVAKIPFEVQHYWSSQKELLPVIGLSGWQLRFLRYPPIGVRLQTEAELNNRRWEKPKI